MAALNHILFIVNKSSGNSNQMNFTEILATYPRPENCKMTVYTMSGEDDYAAIQRQIYGTNPGIVAAVGGDGTINLTASLLIDTSIKLGIIPFGSANGMAAELGIPTDTMKAIDILFAGNTRKIDVVKINKNHLSLHLCDVGLNARIVKNFEEEGGKRGLKGYAKQLIKELVRPEKSFSMKFNNNGTFVKIKAIMAVIANSTRYGTGAIINPTGILDDGRFELIILRPYPVWFMLKLIFVMFAGTIHRQKFVKVYSLTKTDIQLSEPHELQIDGEIQGLHQRIQAESIPLAIEVLVP